MRSHSAIRFLTAEGLRRVPVDDGRIQPVRNPIKDMPFRYPRAPIQRAPDTGTPTQTVERIITKWEKP
jgi:hypothetical protein